MVTTSQGCVNLINCKILSSFQIFRGYASDAIYADPFLHITGLLSLTAGQQIWVSPVNLEDRMQGIEGTTYESWSAGYLVHAV